ncbi:hypothetical protein PVK06_042712 [Gossypium arboreum]|uniref:Uncharacterized protein n=1 Tax=Gossypium arboreum TaxID=29729 RepID=A0ABR0MLP8_GOSAR|nr:hypothetical protein PVK06_042712 [Gossypium arboreum]
MDLAPEELQFLSIPYILSELISIPQRSPKAFNLITVAAVVFTVASLYTSKPVSFSLTISAIPKVFKPLFITFAWIALLMFVYDALLIAFLFMFFIAVDTQNIVLSFLAFMSVFYYVCKSYHHQGIDKSALQDHLGGYLGEYMPLGSSIQKENFDA